MTTNTFNEMITLQWKALDETFAHHDSFLHISPVFLFVDTNNSVKWSDMVENETFVVKNVELHEGWVRAAASLPLTCLARRVVPEQTEFITCAMIKWSLYHFCKKLGVRISEIEEIVWPVLISVRKRGNEIHHLHFDYKHPMCDILFKDEHNMFKLLSVIFGKGLVEFSKKRKIESLEDSHASAEEDIDLRASSCTIPRAPPSSPTKVNIRSIMKLSNVCKNDKQWDLLERALFAKRYIENNGYVQLQCDDSVQVEEIKKIFTHEGNYVVKEMKKEEIEHLLFITKY